jgi:hypothetical protein
MTIKQASEMGFDMNKNGKVWHGETETEFRINPPIRKVSLIDFVNIFSNLRYKDGLEAGKIYKIEEIKNALNIQ